MKTENGGAQVARYMCSLRERREKNGNLCRTQKTGVPHLFADERQKSMLWMAVVRKCRMRQREQKILSNCVTVFDKICPAQNAVKKTNERQALGVRSIPSVHTAERTCYRTERFRRYNGPEMTFVVRLHRNVDERHANVPVISMRGMHLIRWYIPCDGSQRNAAPISAENRKISTQQPYCSSTDA